MTKIKDGITGALSGKLGNFIAGIWKGIPYLKRAPEIDKKQERTPAQLANQEKFNFVNLLLVPFHPYVTVGFKNSAERQTEISAAFSLNFHQAITGVYPNLGVDYTSIVISIGDLPNLESAKMELIKEDMLSLSWLQGRSRKSGFDDQLMLVVYCPELKTADGFIGQAQRSDLKCDFSFNPRFIGKTLHVYIGMTSQDRKKIANSQYLGKIEAT